MDSNLKHYSNAGVAHNYAKLITNSSQKLAVSLKQQEGIDLDYDTHFLALLFSDSVRAMDYKNLIPSGKKVLDVGFGRGPSSAPLLRAEYDIHGIDGSPAMLEPCYDKTIFKNSPIKFNKEQLKLKDLSDGILPYEDNQFSIVLSAYSLMYLRENIKMVQEMLRVAKPEASLLFDIMLHTGENEETIATQLPNASPELTYYIPHARHFANTFNENNIGLLMPPEEDKMQILQDSNGCDAPVSTYIFRLIKQ